jgi:hypothetical protein
MTRRTRSRFYFFCAAKMPAIPDWQARTNRNLYKGAEIVVGVKAPLIACVTTTRIYISQPGRVPVELPVILARRC